MPKNFTTFIGSFSGHFVSHPSSITFSSQQCRLRQPNEVLESSEWDLVCEAGARWLRVFTGSRWVDSFSTSRWSRVRRSRQPSSGNNQSLSSGHSPPLRGKLSHQNEESFWLLNSKRSRRSSSTSTQMCCLSHGVCLSTSKLRYLRNSG